MPSIQLCDFRNRSNNYREEVLWQKEIDENEYQRIDKILQNCHNQLGFFKSLAMPVCTYSVKKFAKDFFCPITTRFLSGYFKATERKLLFDLMVCVLTWVTFDLFTFPLRLLTFIPRIFRNAIYGENPLHAYLRNEGIDQQILNKKLVLVTLRGATITETKEIISKFQSNSHRETVCEGVNLRTFDNSYFAFSFFPYRKSIEYVKPTPKQALRERIENELLNPFPYSIENYYSDTEIGTSEKGIDLTENNNFEIQKSHSEEDHP